MRLLRGLGRWALRLAAVLVGLVVLLLLPVLWVETACRGAAVADAYEPILPPEHRRPESRTLMTYPEWHIVHAYDDYAEVIRTGDPHDFGFVAPIRQFWGSACDLMRASAAHGGADWPTRQMIHVIGVSFTAELLAKAAYEETLGRVATWIRGAERSALDDASAQMAADYADFLHQVPWYRWDFERDRSTLVAESEGTVRDREREAALGLEFGGKALYARAIGAAVAATGFDALTMRSIVTGLPAEEMREVEGVTVIGERPEGLEIETPRYEAFTTLARVLAGRGATFVEIAGNDEIMVTAIAAGPDPAALAAFPRQGNPGWRLLRLMPVADLAEALRDPAGGVEHVHDY